MGYSVTYAPGRPFVLDGSGRNMMRLSFAHTRTEDIDEAIRRLGQAVQDELNGVRLMPQ